jgi:hypothetical protein
MRVLRPSLLLFSALALPLLPATLARAQGGPPFFTDDPETPGARHWEVNIGFAAQRTPTQGDYEVPNIDLNYGPSKRIQLKFEIPLALAENRPLPATATLPAQPGNVLGGLGNSLLGVKWRFYQHHPGERFFGSSPDPGPDVVDVNRDLEPIERGPLHHHPFRRHVNFAVSAYPQLMLNNPTRSVARNVVENGPDFFLPIEINGRAGPIRLDTEAGYHFGNHALPQRWSRGLLAGHEFGEHTEIYSEIYDVQDANRVAGAPKQRETILDAGARQTLNASKSVLLLAMAGRSFQTVSRTNSQPSWVAYVGLQFQLGHNHTTTQIQQKVPNETPP